VYGKQVRQGHRDREKVINALKEYQTTLPNGELNRVPEKMLADWAGLPEWHEQFYSMLNSHAHFDLFEALALYRQVRTPDDLEAVAELNLDRALIATRLQDVVLLAIHALHELGAEKLFGILENQESKLKALSIEVGDLAADRALRDQYFGKDSS
jgi:hypothetical protein